MDIPVRYVVRNRQTQRMYIVEETVNLLDVDRITGATVQLKRMPTLDELSAVPVAASHANALGWQGLQHGSAEWECYSYATCAWEAF